MTLTEALAALHEAGRIRSPFLAGMLVEPDERVVAVIHPGGDPFTGSFVRLATPGDPSGDRDWVDSKEALVLTDPATIGCLLALLREASGHAGLSAAEQGEPGPEWNICRWDHEWGTLDWPQGSPTRQPTEGEAIAAALIAMASEVKS